MTVRRTRIALFATGLILSLTWGVACNAVHEDDAPRSPEGHMVITSLQPELDESETTITNPKVEWRRTVNGWESTALWAESGLALPAAALSLHPAVVTLLQALISIGALLTFEFSDEDEDDDLIHMLKK